jgi:hypothetical protein
VEERKRKRGSGREEEEERKKERKRKRHKVLPLSPMHLIQLKYHLRLLE